VTLGPEKGVPLCRTKPGKCDLDEGVIHNGISSCACNPGGGGRFVDWLCPLVGQIPLWVFSLLTSRQPRNFQKGLTERTGILKGAPAAHQSKKSVPTGAICGLFPPNIRPLIALISQISQIRKSEADSPDPVNLVNPME
jgi:hypothetical protein